MTVPQEAHAITAVDTRENAARLCEYLEENYLFRDIREQYTPVVYISKDVLTFGADSIPIYWIMVYSYTHPQLSKELAARFQMRLVAFMGMNNLF